jgi:hypothetical protein
MGVQEYRMCLHLRLLFTLLMISMPDSINMSVAGSSIVRFISMPSDAAPLAARAKRAANDLRRIAGKELKN